MYKVEVQVYGEEGWHGMTMRYDTVEEARAAAESLCFRWTLTTGWRVVNTETGAVLVEG